MLGARWLTADPNTPVDATKRQAVRMGAYSYGCACREVILAALTKKITATPDEIADYLIALLKKMGEVFDAVYSQHERG